MHITELKKEDLDFHLKVTFLADEIEEKIQKELKKLAEQTKIDGFRPGKAPMSMISKKYRDSVKVNILEDVASEVVSKIIKDHNLRVNGNPKLDDLSYEDQKDLEFVLKFELFSKIDLPDFKTFALEKPILEFSDEELTVIFDAFLDKSTEYLEKNEPAMLGDKVVIDAKAYIDGEIFKDAELNDYGVVLGSNKTIDTFEDQLVGAKTHDTLTIKVTFPNDYFEKRLAGKKAEFNATVKNVYNPKRPELNEEFAKELDYDNVEELKNYIKEKNTKSYNYKISLWRKLQLFDKLEEALKFLVPDSSLEKEISSVEKQLSGDESLKGMLEPERIEYFKKIALRRLRIGLMISEYAKEKQIVASTSDIQNELFKISDLFPSKMAELLKIYKENQNFRNNIQASVLENKVIAHILEHEIEDIEKKYSQKDLDAMLDKS